MAKMKTSYAELIQQVQLMEAGLKSKAQEVAKRGIDSQFVTEMEKLREEVENLNIQQEQIKAQLKTKTEELNTKMEQMLDKLRESRKVVKLAIPQVGWGEFGITDKR